MLHTWRRVWGGDGKKFGQAKFSNDLFYEQNLTIKIFDDLFLVINPFFIPFPSHHLRGRPPPQMLLGTSPPRSPPVLGI